MPLGTGNLLIPDNPALPGNSQQGDNAPSGNSRRRTTIRVCQRQNRQMAVGEGGRQSANATGHREAVRARQHRLTGKLPAAGHGPVLPKAKSPNGGWQRGASKRKRHRAPGSRSCPTTPPHRGTPGSGTQAGFAKGKIAKRCLAKGCVKAQTLSAFERSQSAVFPQGRARPVDCTGRPISSASTRPPRRGMRTAPSRWAITEGERPVV